MDRAQIDTLTRALIDQGKLIEGGWIGLRWMALPADADPIQLSEMRKAFFAGARHLLSSIMSTLDEGAEPTDEDLRRMALIEAELDAFGDQLIRDMPTDGRA